MNQPPINPLIVFKQHLEVRSGEFAAALPDHISVARFKRVLLTAVQVTPDLLTVDRRSLWNAAMRAAQDGLLPDGREGAMVVYRGKKGPIAQWLPMVAGLRRKARNSGEIANWEAHVVHQKDVFDYELGDEPRILHKPHLGPDPGPLIAAYSIATLKSGEKSREVMTRAEIEHVRKSSRAEKSGPWFDHFDEMAKKTVVRRHAKQLPMSSEIEELIRRDDDVPELANIMAPEEAAPPEGSALDRFADGDAEFDEPEEDPRAAAYRQGEEAAERGDKLEPIPTSDPELREAYTSGHEEGMRRRGLKA